MLGNKRMLTAKAKYSLKALAFRTTGRRYRSLVAVGQFQSGVDSHRAALHEGLRAQAACSNRPEGRING
jgi:hypothetical protein